MIAYDPAMPSATPRVSVIVPTFNRARLVGPAVRSVLGQTYGDLEVVVVDDGSTDDTADVLAALEDPRVEVLRLPGNSGPAVARNHGIAQARGEVIAFQDSDDRWHKDKLARQLALLDSSPRDVGVVYSGIWRVTPEGERFYVPKERILGTTYVKEGRVLRELARGNFVDLPAAIVRRECLDAVGVFDETYPAIEDWELWLRIAGKYAYAYVAEALVEAPYSPDSISFDHQRNAQAYEILIARYESTFRAAGALAPHWFTLAAHRCACGDIAGSKRALRRSARLARPSRRSVRRFLLSLKGEESFRRAFIPIAEEVSGMRMDGHR